MEPGVIGAGSNSGFQALNLAIQWGAKRVLLIGYDMNAESGVHWYGRNGWQGANNPGDSNFKLWIAAFAGMQDDLKRMGVSVFVAGPSSLSFPKMSIEEFSG